ncbi:U-box domain-containing protein 5 [Arachis duranensis]|uniref:RING-type E3 ubiquitin transferase n=1 Tax=Arachis duranensis TaxID=130453 RepID=A0A6P4DCT5_ARADU|nr:U-box domain-containing protein 5 [Arachis duranensis]XP_020997818.1 U-box domain-containing protein 5 [Arachis duranensis]
MGTDSGEEAESLPNPRSFKVHSKLCVELMKILARVLRIFPAIEEARPRSSSGIESLCLLNNAIDKAKLLLQHCSDCSKLYLALTGNAILQRCQKARKSLLQSLIQIQGMVPVILAAEVSGIIDDLECATFVLDSAEEEAGKVVKELLEQDTDTMDGSAVKALQFAAPRLNITSQKAILIEKRSIKKLRDKIGTNDQKKKAILKFLWYILDKHGNHIIGEEMEKVHSHNDEPISTENSSRHSQQSHQTESDPCLHYDQYRTQTDEFGRATPLEEYKCPISSRLMYDPVVIASGVTYERMWIKKWFDEGNDTCPKTKKKLVHMGMTPNIAMKDLISKWCRNNGVSISDPNRLVGGFHSWEASMTSIKSFGSYINDFNLPLDLSNMSLGSLDTSYNSDVLHSKTTRESNLRSIMTNDDSHKRQAQEQMREANLQLLSELHDLQWDSQCQVIEEVKENLKSNYQAFSSVSPQNFTEPLIRFLNSAYDLHDVKALRAGTQLLLEFVNNFRNGLSNFSEDVFTLLANFLDSEVTGEALAVMEELSSYLHGKAKIAASNALTSILNILNSDNKEFQRQAIVILYNLSFNGEVCPLMLSLKCIPTLLPFFKDRSLLRYCIVILKNLCDTEEGRNSAVETKGFIASVAEILETGSNEEKEHALEVLISLCSQRMDYCRLVMSQYVISHLFYISKNGSDKGQATALELLRLLQDVEDVEDDDSLEPNLNNTSGDSNSQPQERRSSKGSKFLKKLPFLKTKR